MDFAVNAAAWKEWYDSPYPDRTPMPLQNKDGEKDEEEKEVDEKSDEGTEKDGEHYAILCYLLVIQCLVKK